MLKVLTVVILNLAAGFAYSQTTQQVEFFNTRISPANPGKGQFICISTGVRENSGTRGMAGIQMAVSADCETRLPITVVKFDPSNGEISFCCTKR